MTCVHLVDSPLCASPANFIPAAMLSLSAMIRLELPHVNVLSKVDLLRNVGSDMGTWEPMSLEFLRNELNSIPARRVHRLAVPRATCGATRIGTPAGHGHLIMC